MVALGERAWFSYATILLLQTKVIWAMWSRRDLTSGDTAAYFSIAYDWYLVGSTNLAWSPLYTIFYGSFLPVSRDAYTVTTAHRIVLVLVVAVLVLAVMRRLLAPAVAWGAAAWWVVLPLNHNTLYELHLFAVIPVLLAWLILGMRPSSWSRGGAVAVLLGGTLLVRNELFVATVLLAAACLGWEIWEGRRRPRTAHDGRWRRALAYGAPLIAALILFLPFYSASRSGFPELLARVRARHSLNMCQVYAYSYQQRHPEWTKSPWTECQELMRRVFGKDELSLSDAWRANPSALMEHFEWHARLIPSGLQVLFFNATSGRVNPDYVRVSTGSSAALILSGIVVLVCVAGLAALARDRSHSRREWLRPRAWLWVGMLAVTAPTFLVMLMQRPRSAYLFSLEVAGLAAVGTCVQALLVEWRLTRSVSRAFPVLAVALIALVPSYHARPSGAARPLFEAYQRLSPFANVIQRSGRVLMTPGYGVELCHYLRDGTLNVCRAADFYSARSEAQAAGTTLSHAICRRRVNMVYANEHMLADGEVRALLSGRGGDGWSVVARGGRSSPWLLLERSTDPDPCRA